MAAKIGDKPRAWNPNAKKTPIAVTRPTPSGGTITTTRGGKVTERDAQGRVIKKSQVSSSKGSQTVLSESEKMELEKIEQEKQEATQDIKKTTSKQFAQVESQYYQSLKEPIPSSKLVKVYEKIPFVDSRQEKEEYERQQFGKKTAQAQLTLLLQKQSLARVSREEQARSEQRYEQTKQTAADIYAGRKSHETGVAEIGQIWQGSAQKTEKAIKKEEQRFQETVEQPVIQEAYSKNVVKPFGIMDYARIHTTQEMKKTRDVAAKGAGYVSPALVYLFKPSAAKQLSTKQIRVIGEQTFKETFSLPYLQKAVRGGKEKAVEAFYPTKTSQKGYKIEFEGRLGTPTLKEVYYGPYSAEKERMVERQKYVPAPAGEFGMRTVGTGQFYKPSEELRKAITYPTEYYLGFTSEAVKDPVKMAAYFGFAYAARPVLGALSLPLTKSAWTVSKPTGKVITYGLKAGVGYLGYRFYLKPRLEQFSALESQQPGKGFYYAGGVTSTEILPLYYGSKAFNPFARAIERQILREQSLTELKRAYYGTKYEPIPWLRQAAEPTAENLNRLIAQQTSIQFEQTLWKNPGLEMEPVRDVPFKEIYTQKWKQELAEQLAREGYVFGSASRATRFYPKDTALKFVAQDTTTGEWVNLDINALTVRSPRDVDIALSTIDKIVAGKKTELFDIHLYKELSPFPWSLPTTQTPGGIEVTQIREEAGRLVVGATTQREGEFYRFGKDIYSQSKVIQNIIYSQPAKAEALHLVDLQKTLVSTATKTSLYWQTMGTKMSVGSMANPINYNFFKYGVAGISLAVGSQPAVSSALTIPNLAVSKATNVPQISSSIGKISKITVPSISSTKIASSIYSGISSSYISKPSKVSYPSSIASLSYKPSYPSYPSYIPSYPYSSYPSSPSYRPSYPSYPYVPPSEPPFVGGLPQLSGGFRLPKIKPKKIKRTTRYQPSIAASEKIFRKMGRVATPKTKILTGQEIRLF